jgi:hypothetical protein
MKRASTFFVLVIVCLSAIIVYAGSRFINYQGVLIKAGEPVTEETQVIFKIFESELATTDMWSETDLVTPDNKGKFHVKVGKLTAFGDTVFNGNERWMSITVDGQELLPRTELGSVPFANLAQNVPDAAIGTQKIKKNAIVDSLIGEKEIGQNKIKNNAIADSLIEKDAIVDSLIKNKEIGHEKIKNKAIVDSLIANDAIVDTLIKDGTIKFADIGQNGAQDGQVMKWSGAMGHWVAAEDLNIIDEDEWGFNPAGTVLITGGEWGIARKGSTLYGSNDSTHINLGVTSQTGESSYDIKYATVGGGTDNWASEYISTVCGGEENKARNVGSTVCGGFGNQAGNGDAAGVGYNVVGGGYTNNAFGYYATVPGGRSNSAYGDYTLAAGTVSKANHPGSIVISANTAGGAVFNPADSTWTRHGEQMILRADSGFYFTNKSEDPVYQVSTRLIATTTGACLTTAGVWQDNCDRDTKENFADIDKTALLKKVASLPITQWNYKIDGNGITHIGPVAQDFYSVFGVGYDDKSIAAMDEAGIALAAIQELHKKVERIDELENEVAALKKLVEELLEQGRQKERGSKNE